MSIKRWILQVVLSIGIFILLMFSPFLLASFIEAHDDDSPADRKLEYVENIEDDKINSVSEAYPITSTFFSEKDYFVLDEKGDAFLVEVDGYGPTAIFSHKSQEVKEGSKISEMLDETIAKSKK